MRAISINISLPGPGSGSAPPEGGGGSLGRSDRCPSDQTAVTDNGIEQAGLIEHVSCEVHATREADTCAMSLRSAQVSREHCVGIGGISDAGNANAEQSRDLGTRAFRPTKSRRLPQSALSAGGV